MSTDAGTDQDIIAKQQHQAALHAVEQVLKKHGVHNRRWDRLTLAQRDTVIKDIQEYLEELGITPITEE